MLSAALVTGLAALAVAFITGAFAFITSRKTNDDSRAIGLINAGQVALERSLERATQEIMDAREQITGLRKELGEVRAELLRAHTECEKERRELAAELARLHREIERLTPP